MRKIWVLSGIALSAFMGFVGLLVVAVYVVAASVPGGGRGGQLERNSVPAEYESLIQRWGNLCPTLTPARLAAQINQESGWQSDAASVAEAQGIAQFIPSTWAVHGIDANGNGTADVWDPEDAIPSAATYNCTLAEQLAGVPGDPVDNMLAAYNAGPYAVIQYSGVPPYEETQNYVRVIRGAEEAYEAREERLPPSELAASVVHFAQERLGTPYLWGGDGGPEDDGRFDCSGLTKAAYESVGIELPRVANDQWDAGPHPGREELLPGDLVFFAHDLTDSRSIHHVGLYVGGGYMIDAPYSGAEIRFDPVDSPDYFGATRPTEA